MLAKFVPVKLLNSVSDSMQISCLLAQRQIGSGVPQYRFREIAQSMLLFSQSPYRPVLIVEGYQFVAAFSFNNLSLIAVVFMYQEGWAYYIKTVWQRQQ